VSDWAAVRVKAGPTRLAVHDHHGPNDVGMMFRPRRVQLLALAADNRAVNSGGPDLDALYRELQPALLRHLRVGHAGQAEDIAGDVWTEVAAISPRFVGDDDDFRAWVFTLARRRLIDSYRRAGRRPTDRLVGDLREMTAAGPEDETVARISLDATIARLRQLLPADQAQVVVLRLVNELSVDEVARLTAKTPVNVRVLQHRALHRLSRRLHHKEAD
jgi:RNA polymerase sigma-70 factor (ECF subfamily)